MEIRDLLINPASATQGSPKKILLNKEINAILGMYKSALKKEDVSLKVSIHGSSQLKTNDSF